MADTPDSRWVREDRKNDPALSVLSLYFSENWAHIRHVESERRWLFAAISALTAGALVYGSSTEAETWLTTLLAAVLTAFGVISFLYSVRAAKTINSCRNRLENIGREFTATVDSEFPFEESVFGPRSNKPVPARYLYPLLSVIYTMATLIALLALILDSM